MKLIRTETAAITKALARHWAEMTPCEHDRPLRKLRMDSLARDIVAGKAVLFNWACAIIVGDAREIRVNGKHSSTLLSRMEPFPTGLKASMATYECADLAEVADLYAQFDGGMTVRTQRDVNRVVQASSSLASMKLHAFDACVSGLVMALHREGDTHGNLLAQEDKARLAADHEPFCLWFTSINGNDDAHQIFERMSVVSAMFLTWSKNHNKATEFWCAVRDGNEPAGSPTRVLQRYLDRTACRFGGVASRRGAKRADSPGTMETRCLHAWNAWRTGGNTDLKVYGTKRPEVK